jgi:hypothetical protein
MFNAFRPPLKEDNAMKASLFPRVLAFLGALVMSAIVIAPYEVAFAVRAVYSVVEANSAGWLLVVRNTGLQFRI